MTRTRTAALLLLIFSLCAPGAAFGFGFSKKKPVTIAAEDVAFVPLDPNYPEGPQIGVVQGNPQKGRSTFFLKLKPGPTPLHSHSSSYQATVVQGMAKHWPKGGEATAKTLLPGSYWYQPKKQPHGDACVSQNECIIFIEMEGKFDFVPAAE
ncbi:MAG TPA: DUF4437 domain-containing protein [Bdellovibrionales bacterium]|nr:DUF4437 domain-containing protein [Bdellovibrionales bacterium]